MTKREFASITRELQLTQVELADHMDVDGRTVRRWIANNLTDIPGPAVAALRAWRKCNRYGLAWGKSRDLAEIAKGAS